MQIIASNVQLASASVFEARQSVTERLRIGTGPAQQNHDDGDRFEHGASLDQAVTKLTRLLQHYLDGDYDGRDGGRIARRIDHLIQRIQGQLASADGSHSGPGSVAPADDATPNQIHLDYTRRESYQEVEATSFRATGSVVTADGRQIDFAQAFDLARAYARKETISVHASLSPAALAALGNSTPAPADPAATASAKLAPTGQQAVAINGAALAYDANGDGQIDPAHELIGQSGDSFAELARLDSDGNGFVDSGDAAFSRLALVDSAGGGIVSNTLASQGIGALYTGSVATPYTYTDSANQPVAQLGRAGIYLNENGTTGVLAQVNVLA